MSAPGLDEAVQKAVRHALMNDVGVVNMVADRIYDRVSPGARFPYLVIGEDQIADDSNTCSDASDILATVRVFSEKPGKVEAKMLGGYVRRALGQPLSIEGHVNEVGHFETAVYRPDADGLRTEGVLLFRYLVDPLT